MNIRRIFTILGILFNVYAILAIEPAAAASRTCAELLANRPLLASIISEVQLKTDARTVGALDALRSVELPLAVAKTRIEDILSKDSYLSKRLSPYDRGDLADALIDVSNKRRGSLKVIHRFIFLKELPAPEPKQAVAKVEQPKSQGDREQLRSDVIGQAQDYLNAEWLHFSVVQRKGILAFIETAILADPLFQQDPVAYLRELQKNRGGLEMLITPNDQAQSFLENLEERGELRIFAAKVANAGFQNTDPSVLMSAKWNKPARPAVVSNPPPAPAPVTGIIESRIATNELRMKDIEQQAQQLITQLDRGGADWRTLSPAFVETIVTAVKEYNHTNFDVYTSQMAEAIEKIKTTLRTSVEFSVLDASKIEDVARALASGNRNLRTPMFGTKHMLYHLLVEMGVSQSQAQGLTRLLVSLQGLGKQAKQLSEGNWALENMLNGGLKGVASIRDLEARYRQVQSELNTSSAVPNDLVTSIVALAQEYNGARMGNFDVLTPGMNEAIRKYKKLVSEHPFFRNVEQSELENLQWNWNRATTPQNAINILSSLVGSNDVEAKRQELQLLAQAIQYFREN